MSESIDQQPDNVNNWQWLPTRLAVRGSGPIYETAIRLRRNAHLDA
jgi:hypothetical protein